MLRQVEKSSGYVFLNFIPHYDAESSFQSAALIIANTLQLHVEEEE